MNTIERILVPTDFSPGSDAAADVAAELATRLNTTVDVITVVDTSAFAEIYRDPELRKERIEDVHATARNRAGVFASRHFRGLDGVSVHVRDGNTFLELIQAARDLNSGIVVIGTHGRTGLAHLLIGSVAEKVVRASPIPVMTVRAPR